jgi:hypothetical protein
MTVTPESEMPGRPTLTLIGHGRLADGTYEHVRVQISDGPAFVVHFDEEGKPAKCYSEVAFPTPAPAAEPHGFTLNPDIQRQVPGRYVTDDDAAEPAGKVGEKQDKSPAETDARICPKCKRFGHYFDARTSRNICPWKDCLYVSDKLTPSPCPRCESFEQDAANYRRVCAVCNTACLDMLTEYDCLACKLLAAEQQLHICQLAAPMPEDVENLLDAALLRLHTPNDGGLEVIVGQALAAARKCVAERDSRVMSLDNQLLAAERELADARDSCANILADSPGEHGALRKLTLAKLLDNVTAKVDGLESELAERGRVIVGDGKALLDGSWVRQYADGSVTVVNELPHFTVAGSLYLRVDPIFSSKGGGG